MLKWCVSRIPPQWNSRSNRGGEAFFLDIRPGFELEYRSRSFHYEFVGKRAGELVHGRNGWRN